MNAREISLVSPSGSSIIGFLTKSGTICPVKCKFMRRNGENSFFFEIPQGMMDEIVNDNGDRVCVDESGKHWSAGDIMWASAPRGA